MKTCKSECPVNQALEVFGDTWSLIIIRDIMFVGKRYFRELLDSKEKIASNILTDRLNKLECRGILIKTKDENHKQKNVYTLTKKGIDLLPIMIEIIIWSYKHEDLACDDKEKIEEVLHNTADYITKTRVSLEKEYAIILKKKTLKKAI